MQSHPQVHARFDLKDVVTQDRCKPKIGTQHRNFHKSCSEGVMWHDLLTKDK